MNPHEEKQAEALEAKLSAEDLEMLDELADGIARRRLTAAAVFFLESMKPLNFVGSQLMYFFQPMVQIIWRNPHRYERLAKILSDRGSVELLLRRLEARA